MGFPSQTRQPPDWRTSTSTVGDWSKNSFMKGKFNNELTQAPHAHISSVKFPREEHGRPQDHQKNDKCSGTDDQILFRVSIHLCFLICNGKKSNCIQIIFLKLDVIGSEIYSQRSCPARPSSICHYSRRQLSMKFSQLSTWLGMSSTNTRQESCNPLLLVRKKNNYFHC